MGDGAVGKTALVKRLLTGEFEQRYVPTRGADVRAVVFHTRSPGGEIKYNIWVRSFP